MTEIVAVSEQNNAVIARIVNVPNVDLFNMVRLREALENVMKDEPKAFVIDLTEVTYVDSSGLGLLITIKLRTDKYGGKLYLAGCNVRVRKMFELTGVDKKIRIFETLREALDNVSVRKVPDERQSHS